MAAPTQASKVVAVDAEEVALDSENDRQYYLGVAACLLQPLASSLWRVGEEAVRRGSLLHAAEALLGPLLLSFCPSAFAAGSLFVHLLWWNQLWTVAIEYWPVFL